MEELAISLNAAGTLDEIETNVKYARSLGLRELSMAPCQNGGQFILCASGPSIQDHVEDIRKDQEDGYPVCAVKGAYDFLRENGITPDLYISVEPRYRPIKDPSKKTVYLLASRCHKDDFDNLKEFTVVLWHSWTGQEETLYKGFFGIGGGSTSGLRAVNIAFILGFKHIKMYGMDSCNMAGEKRVGQGKVHKLVETIGIKPGKDGKEYICTMGMAQQANEFQMIWDIMPGIHVEVFGNGLLAAICKERVRTGLPV